MVSVIAWKEWRQQIALVVAILALAGIGLTATALFNPHDWANRSHELSPSGTWVILLAGLAVTQGVVTGAMLFAGETEEQTQDFLDQHGALRGPIWRAKMLSGASLAGSSALVLGVAIVALQLSGPAWMAACVWFGLDAFVWSAACSAWRKTTFGAIAVALAVLVVVAGLPLGLLESIAGAFAYLVIKVLLLIAALGISWRLYCSADLRRIRVVAAPDDWSKSPTWLTVSLWHLWKSRKGTLALLAVGPIVVVVATIRWATLLSWPVGTFLLGCIAGWAVFAGDQAAGAERFLGDQRFPRIRMWCGKTLPLLALALVGGALALLAMVQFVSGLRHSSTFDRLFYLFDLFLIESLPQSFGRGFVFLVQGFAFAAFAAQQARKWPVAFFLTLTVGTAAAALWYPSLYAGMPVWYAFVPPALFMLATLWLWPRWTSGRLHDRGGILRLAGLLAAAVLWLGGSLWWRVAQIPDPGEPFDKNAHLKSLRETPDEHGAALREASLRLQERLREADEQFPTTDQDGFPVHPDWWEAEGRPLQWSEFRKGVVASGLPTKPGAYADYLDFVYAGDWVELFRKAAAEPPDRFQSLGDFGSGSRDRFAAARTEAIDFLLIRSLMHLRDGHPDRAVDDIATALAAVRHGMHNTFGQCAFQFLGAHSTVLEFAQRTLDHPAANRVYRSRLTEVLARHSDLLPSFEGIVRSGSLLIADDFDAFRWGDPVHMALINAPWERERLRRMIGAATASLLREARENRFSSATEQIRKLSAIFQTPPPPAGVSHGDANLRLYLAHNLVELYYLDQSRWLYAHGLWSLRGLRLSLAAAQFEEERGRPIDSIEELVPGQFERLPSSPFAGRTFQVRVSEGEQVYAAGWHRPSTAGQRIIDDSAESRQVVLVPMPLKK